MMATIHQDQPILASSSSSYSIQDRKPRDVSYDHESLTSKSDSIDRNRDHISFAEAEYDGHLPLSPSSSAHSSNANENQSESSGRTNPISKSELPPLRPAYLYLEGEEADPPLFPTDDIKGVPVFMPTWEEFKDFYSYCSRIDEWGMRSGIVKIIPPKEWKDGLPRLDGRQSDLDGRAGERYTDSNRLSQVRIKNSIEQIFTPAGAGVWRQSNVVHPARIVNAKQWADICAQEDRRGPEMKRMKEVARRKEDDVEEDGVRTRSGRGKGAAGSQPSSSKLVKESMKRKRRNTDSVEPDSDHAKEIGAGKRTSPRKSSTANLSASSPASSLAPNKPKMADRTTQSEWDQFDYKNDWSKEAGEEAKAEDWAMDICKAIEKEYWRGLNYGKPPMYGADLSGTLFTPETQEWNVGKLDNILTRLRLKRKLPGVTTPYLYFGMWRATFAWHVEDMDLYSINYIHFGAPKQWYSIRQADKQRFEIAMASAFPADSSRCRHFMRHKSYLASPSFIESAAGRIKPLRLVQKAQEIVLTYPYGYHSGYNLGFNCAESVNFALERWLDIGRKATYCECTDDTVKMDVDAMLDESKEMEELDRKRIERERRREEEEHLHITDEDKAEARKARERERRKRRKEENSRLGVKQSDEFDEDEEDELPAKKIKIESFPCEFCPSISKEDLIVIPTNSSKNSKVKGDSIKRAHRLCASFLPETWIATITKSKPKEVVMGFEGIPKARWSLKCQNCKDPNMSKRGAKVQCTYGRCSRTSHVSCALKEGSGWMLDVLPESEADEIEGRVKSKGSSNSKKGKGRKAIANGGREDEEEVENFINGQSQAGEEEEDDEKDPRMVMLCKVHNPYEREREASYKVDILRVCLQALIPSQRICVRTGNGLWETSLQKYAKPPQDEQHKFDEGDIILIDGTQIKGSKVIFDSETMRLAEDVVWYRDEAEFEREKGQIKAAYVREQESKQSLFDLHNYIREQDRRSKELINQQQIVKLADRDVRAAEIERKRREHEREQQEQTNQQSTNVLSINHDINRSLTPIVPSQPAGIAGRVRFTNQGNDSINDEFLQPVQSHHAIQNQNYHQMQLAQKVENDIQTKTQLHHQNQ